MKAHDDPNLLQYSRMRGVAGTLTAQHGVILRSQALAAGMPRAEIDNAVRRHRWRIIHPRVMVAVNQTSPFTALWAAWLWAGPGAAITGVAAAVWYRMLQTVPATIDIYVPHARARQVPPGIRLHRSPINLRDTRDRGGLTVMTAARACIDAERFGHHENLMMLGLRRAIFTTEHLKAALAGCRGYLDYAATAARVTAMLSAPWSPAEARLHELLEEAGIVGWVANARALTATGAVRPDIAFRNIKLAIEVNGRAYHDEAADPRAFDKDHRRTQALLAAGWVVLPFTAKQVFTEPDLVIATIRQMLDRLQPALP